MTEFMKRLAPHTYALLRVVAGLLFLWHGTQKLFGYPVPLSGEIPAFVIWVGGSIELVGGVLVMLGLFTRWAAFVCSGQMAVAYWTAHAPKGLFPLQFGGNGGELAVLYCFVFLYIAARGPGLWSLDRSE